MANLYEKIDLIVENLSHETHSLIKEPLMESKTHQGDVDLHSAGNILVGGIIKPEVHLFVSKEGMKVAVRKILEFAAIIDELAP
jgi:hypothetical protein